MHDNPGKLFVPRWPEARGKTQILTSERGKKCECMVKVAQRKLPFGWGEDLTECKRPVRKCPKASVEEDRWVLRTAYIISNMGVYGICRLHRPNNSVRRSMSTAYTFQRVRLKWLGPPATCTPTGKRGPTGPNVQLGRSRPSSSFPAGRWRTVLRS